MSARRKTTQRRLTSPSRAPVRSRGGRSSRGSQRSQGTRRSGLFPKTKTTITSPATRLLATAFMLVNVLTWGAALPISKFAVEHTSPYHFLFFRFGGALLLSLPMLLWYLWKLRPNLRLLGQVILLELLGTSLALGALYLGLAQTSALEASFLVTTIPVFVTIGGIWFLKEKQEGWEWLGLLMAVGGTLLLVFEPLLSGRNHVAEFSVLGNLLILVSNIATAAYFLLAKKYYRPLPKLFVTTVSFWVGAATFFFLSWWQLGSGLPQLLAQLQLDLTQPLVLWPSLYMAVFGSIIGLTAYIAGQNLIEASEASVFSYLQPLVYIPLAIWLHGDTLQPVMILAVVVIALGVFITEWRWRRGR